MKNETVMALLMMDGIDKETLCRFLLNRESSLSFKNSLFDMYLEKARDLIRKQEKEGIVTLNITHDSFPPGLKRAGVPILHAKGNIDLLKGSHIAVTGDRYSTLQGTMAAFILGSRISEQVTVVSGLANGCDTLAHKGAVHAGGDTIAVLPSPLDDIFPKEKIGLADKIVENGGLLISEYPTGTEVEEKNFADRDRVLMALCEGIAIAEAYRGGDTKYRVGNCMKQGKPIGCFPGIGDLNKWLLKEKKALPLGTPREVAEFIADTEK